MQVPAALLAVSVCIAALGCATPQQQGPTSGARPATAATVKQPQQEARYRTGSRVPLPADEEGAQSVSAASREAHEEEMRRVMNGARGN